eukprot:Skav209473  [mRNA]  locus=scaffold3498:325114:328506:- [translate_table: standard]
MPVSSAISSAPAASSCGAGQLLPPTKFPEEQNVKLVLLVGVVEFFGWAALQQVAVAGGLGVSAALLSGVSLLVTLASAQLLLQSRVKASAWIGAMKLGRTWST